MDEFHDTSFKLEEIKCLFLVEHHSVKTYGGVELQPHEFTSP